MHLGGLRTALFNYLLARRTGGQFILRIEDTDQVRTVPGAEQKLLDDLKWAGIEWHEGPDVGGPYGPYRQSDRLPLYTKHAQRLIDEGKAYRCFCSQEDLTNQSKLRHEKGEPTHYPGTCRSVSPEESEDRASKGESFVVRFRSSPTPVAVDDIVYQTFKKKTPEDDYIIIKSDGFPTYHFANVVDDKHMNITHVIRGAEWLVSTPKHVELYHAFGWEPPQFAHVGLLVDSASQKLSKRHGAIAELSTYQDRNTIPSALLNFLLLLGWSKDPSIKSDVLTMEGMIKNFSLKFTRGDIKVAFKKLDFFQNSALQRLRQTGNPEWPAFEREYYLRPITTHIQTLISAQQSNPPSSSPPKTNPRPSSPPPSSAPPSPANRIQFTASPERSIRETLAHVWTEELEKLPGDEEGWAEALEDTHLQERVKRATGYQVFKEKEGKPAAEMPGYKLLRWALVGGKPGGTVWKVMALLGKEETGRRLVVAGEVADEALREGVMGHGKVDEASV
ncbi:hypothetical protein B0T16DRAFT_413706 [Cercophora newfieldiana]|uniref:Glutamate--tRNA ligase, mitochondrial n=1 Tax=Cercophora newfieldiana TaxID=92897 RepID=A0AA39Y5Y5_9PEZI|nr:hypothetical protein B0T16DRAFT_413706 [Cercophora newfieldiana]